MKRRIQSLVAPSRIKSPITPFAPQDSLPDYAHAQCKADNVVTRDEINAVEQIFDMLKLQGGSRRRADLSC